MNTITFPYRYVHLHVQTYTIAWWISTATFPNSNTAANLFSAHHILCYKSFTARFWQRWHTAKDKYTVSTETYKHKRHKWIYSQSIWEISLIIFYLLILNIFIKGKLIVLHYLMKTKYRFHLPKSLNIYYQFVFNAAASSAGTLQIPPTLRRASSAGTLQPTPLQLVVHTKFSWHGFVCSCSCWWVEWQQSGRT